MPDIKQYGIKGIGSDVQFGKQSGRITYDTDHFNVRNKNDSAYQTIRALDPSNDADLATKAYVDSVAKGLIIKDAVKAATNILTSVDSNVTGTPVNDINNLTYDSSADTWSHTINSIQFDQYIISNGDRVLIKDASGSDKRGNGIFTYSSGDKKFTRATDADNAGLATSELKGGTFVYVNSGAVWGGTSWVITAPTGSITLKTDNITWSQFSGTTSVLPSDGLTKTNDYLSVRTDGTTLSIISDNVSVNSSNTAGQILKSFGTQGVAPTWGALDLSNSNSVTNFLPGSNGGLGEDFSSYTNGKIIVKGISGGLAKGNQYDVLQVGSSTLEYGKVSLADSTSGTLSISRGGTGATTQSAAATALGVGTGDSPTFTGLTVSGSSASFNGLTYTMPSVAGTADQLLTTDASGNLSWNTFAVGPGTLELPAQNDTNNYINVKWTVLYCNTFDATPSPLFLTGTNTEIPVPTDTTMAFDAKVVARNLNQNESFVFLLKGMAVNNAGSVTIYNQGTEIISEQDADWDAFAESPGTNLRIRVTGEAGKTILWTALVNTVEVTY